MKKLFFLLFTSILLACNYGQKNDSTEASIDSASVSKDIISQVDYSNIEEDTIEGYHFKFGYYKYNEDSFGFDNPGFFEVFNNSKMIFYDSIKAYETLHLHSLGYHYLGSKMLAVTLNYGLEACDYPQGSRLYCISDKDKVWFIDELPSSGNEYAGHYSTLVFPEDSNGIENKLMIIEALEYNEPQEGETNKYDTTIYEFKNNGFKKTRQTHNINPNS